MRVDSDAIQIQRVQESELDAMLELYVDLFADREPLTRCIGFSKQRMREVARSMYSGAHAGVLSQGLCWMARDAKEGGRPVGLIVCDDPAAPGAQQIPDNLTDEEMKIAGAVASLLEKLREPIQERLSSVGVCLHVAAIGVYPDCEGRGVGTRLLQAALQEAESRGFGCAFAECTGPASRRLHEKAGFKSIGSISVSRFLFDGEYPLANCQADVHLMRRSVQGSD